MDMTNEDLDWAARKVRMLVIAALFALAAEFSLQAWELGR
jgi:hypothetical protein